MKDKEFLAWLHDRLECIHFDNRNLDFMIRLRAIIDRTPRDQDTNFGGEASIENKIAIFKTIYSEAHPGALALCEIIEALNKRVDQIKGQQQDASSR